MFAIQALKGEDIGDSGDSWVRRGHWTLVSTRLGMDAVLTIRGQVPSTQ